MKLKKELLKGAIAGEVCLIPVGKTVYDSNGMFFLTELAAFIWDLLPQVESQEEILQAVLAEYDVDENQAAADIGQFLDKLREMHIL